jgi:hypothetical protein
MVVHLIHRSIATQPQHLFEVNSSVRFWGTIPIRQSYRLPMPVRQDIHALKLLEHYRGIVQCDEYAAYKSLPNHARFLLGRSPAAVG